MASSCRGYLGRPARGSSRRDEQQTALAVFPGHEVDHHFEARSAALEGGLSGGVDGNTAYLIELFKNQLMVFGVETDFQIANLDGSLNAACSAAVAWRMSVPSTTR